MEGEVGQKVSLIRYLPSNSQQKQSFAMNFTKYKNVSLDFINLFYRDEVQPRCWPFFYIEKFSYTKKYTLNIHTPPLYEYLVCISMLRSAH